MTDTPITDHWWDRANFDGDDRRVGRLLSLKGLAKVTQVKPKALDAKTTEYAETWDQRGPHGEVNDPNVLRHMWVYRGVPGRENMTPEEAENEKKAWIRIWEYEEVKRWMNESTDYRNLPKRGDV